MRPQDSTLIRDNIRDLISDYRATCRDLATGDAVKYHDTRALVGLAEYAAECREKAFRIFRSRHTAKIGKFGETIPK